MGVVRGIWRVLVGVKDALSLLLLLLFFAVLWSAMHGKSTLIVPDGAALVLNLDGQIVDQASERPLLAAFSGQAGVKQIQVRDVLKAINNARTDDRIKDFADKLYDFSSSDLS